MSTWGDFMFCNDCRSAVFRSDKNNVFVLAIIWVLGFVVGCYFGCNYRSVFAHIVRRHCVVANDLVAQYLVFSSVLFLSFLSILFRCRFLIYCFSFLEGSAYGSILVGLAGCFPTFGWLLAFLFLLPKTLILIGQFAYWQICFKSMISSAFISLILVLTIFVPTVVFVARLIGPIIFYLLDNL